MNTPDRRGWSQRTQRGIVASESAGLEMRNETQVGSMDSPVSKPSRSATALAIGSPRPMPFTFRSAKRTKGSKTRASSSEVRPSPVSRTLMRTRWSRPSSRLRASSSTRRCSCRHAAQEWLDVAISAQNGFDARGWVAS